VAVKSVGCRGSKRVGLNWHGSTGARVVDSCRRFRIDRAAQSTALHSRTSRRLRGQCRAVQQRRWVKRVEEKREGGAAARGRATRRRSGYGRSSRGEQDSAGRAGEEVRVKVEMAGGRRSVAGQGCRARSCPHVKEAGQGWAWVGSQCSPGGTGTAALSPTYRIDNVYQDAVASTRAAWDGKAAASARMGTIAAVMDEGGQKKRVINAPGCAGGFTASTSGKRALASI
jgi:hypothetical protein